MLPGFFTALIILMSALNAVETPVATPPDQDVAETFSVFVPGGKPQPVPPGETATALMNFFQGALSGQIKPARACCPEDSAAKSDLYVALYKDSRRVACAGYSQHIKFLPISGN